MLNAKKALQQDKESLGSDASHAEKAFFFFKDKESLESDASHAEKAFFFFKDKESLESDTSHAEKASLPFQRRLRFEPFYFISGG
ncbi:hypothetical protein [Virgibacillus pantothenticus]|uniref:hypothetical protein n=1 Tax=Virgibacillus pantothenticus TaxID=1473 RepID=UPI001B36FB4A|nr:hypothetical protein [Virgibacillus pantothenticus]QTY16175.1 hypothetical protein KBP50_20575 [Virgibacillus pantothenticus]